MASKRYNFLSRLKPDQITRDVTTYYVPSVGGKIKFYRLDTTGRVVVESGKKSLVVMRTKASAKKKKPSARRKGAYLETVTSLAGRDR